MSKYLRLEDFEDVGFFNLYLAALFAKTLYPKVNEDYAQGCLEGFLIYYAEQNGEVEPEDIVSLAEEIMEGPQERVLQ